MLQSFSLFCCCASTFSVCVLAGKQLIGAQNLFVSNCAAYHLDLHLCEYSNLDIKPLFSCSFTLICKYILSSLFHQPYQTFTTGFRTILIHLIEKEHSSFFFMPQSRDHICAYVGRASTHTHTSRRCRNILSPFTAKCRLLASAYVHIHSERTSFSCYCLQIGVRREQKDNKVLCCWQFSRMRSSFLNIRLQFISFL